MRNRILTGKTKYTRVLLWLTMLCLSPAICVSMASEDVSPVVVVGGDKNNAPFLYPGKDGKPVGLVADILKAIGEEMEFRVVFKFSEDEAMALEQLETDAVDIIALTMTSEVAHRFSSSAPFLFRDYVLFGRGDSAQIYDISGSGEVDIVVKEGGLAQEWLLSNNYLKNTTMVPSYMEAFASVSSGKHDYLLAPRYYSLYQLQNLRETKLLQKSPPLVSFPYVFATNKKNDGLTLLLNKGLALLRENGKFEDIEANWHKSLGITSEHNRVWYIISLFALVCVCLTLIYYKKLENKYHLKEVTEKLSTEIKHRTHAEEKYAFLANHDELTRLPLRNKFLIELPPVFQQAKTRAKKIPILCIRFTNLSQINRHAGYEIGDQLLERIAALIRGNPYPVAYLAPGVFAICLEPVIDHKEAVSVAEKIIEKLKAPLLIQDFHLEILLSSGLAVYPDHATDAHRLLQNAELAESIATKTHGQLQVYSANFEPDSRVLVLLSDFNKALHEDQFQLQLQPKVDIATLDLRGAEVLVRWHHPEFGLMGPGQFVPLLEETGLIKDLTKYVITKTVELQYRMKDLLPTNLSVNISVRDLVEPKFAQSAIDIISDVNGEITFEVTETAAAGDSNELLMENIELFKLNNIALSIDDFGTGYSSLRYLRDIKPAELKIDRLFITDLINDKNDQILVQSTAGMARALQTKIVAEGVENWETVSLLKDLGCDLMQGYGIGKPMDPEHFVAWMSTDGNRVKI